MDTTKLGELMADFMDQVAEDYGEEAEVSEAIIVAGITVPLDDGGKLMSSTARCSSPSPLVQAGLIAWGKQVVMGEDD